MLERTDTITQTNQIIHIPTRQRTQQRDLGLRFDWAMTLTATWLTIGFSSDSYAHSHALVDNFWTPWHGILYSGFAALASLFLITILANHFYHRLTWHSSIPAGYNVVAGAVALFVVGGIGDMIWHSLFGIEISIEAIISPTHMILTAAILMLLSGPLSAAWQRRGGNRLTWATGLPALLSLLYILFLALGGPLEFLNLFVPYNILSLNRELNESAFAAVIVHPALLIGILLTVLRRWPILPFGSMTLLFTGMIAQLQIVFSAPTIPTATSLALVLAAAATGVFADVLLRWLKPGPANLDGYRTFALLVPVALYSGYFVTVALTYHLAWRIHIWAGMTVVAGAVGWVVSLCLFPSRSFVPPVPADGTNDNSKDNQEQ